jgi:hypothetical protein
MKVKAEAAADETHERKTMHHEKTHMNMKLKTTNQKHHPTQNKHMTMHTEKKHMTIQLKTIDRKHKHTQNKHMTMHTEKTNT